MATIVVEILGFLAIVALLAALVVVAMDLFATLTDFRAVRRAGRHLPRPRSGDRRAGSWTAGRKYLTRMSAGSGSVRSEGNQRH